MIVKQFIQNKLYKYNTLYQLVKTSLSNNSISDGSKNNPIRHLQLPN